jgi:four helix bundle protein
MQDFKKLVVWELSHLVTLDVYKATKLFPKEELFALTSQIRRAAYSVPLNLAEGCGRFTQADKAHFFQIAFGSLQELEYSIILSKDLGYLNEVEFEKLNIKINEIKQKLISLISKVRDKKL